MNSLIVRINSRKEWKKVAKKAISLGYIWNGGETTALTKDIYDDYGLNEEEDVFLFLYGDDTRFNMSTGKKGTLVWGTNIGTEGTNHWSVDEQELPEYTAEEFLSLSDDAILSAPGTLNKTKETKELGELPDKVMIPVHSQEEWKQVVEYTINVLGFHWQGDDTEVHDNWYEPALGMSAYPYLDTVIITLNQEVKVIGHVLFSDHAGNAIVENYHVIDVKEFLDMEWVLTKDLNNEDILDKEEDYALAFIVPVNSPEERRKVIEKGEQDSWEPFLSEYYINNTPALEGAVAYVIFYSDPSQGVRSLVSLNDESTESFKRAMDKKGVEVNLVNYEAFMSLEQEDEDVSEALFDAFSEFTKRMKENNDQEH